MLKGWKAEYNPGGQMGPHVNILDETGDVIIHLYVEDDIEKGEAYAKRICGAVNAVKGISNAALEDGMVEKMVKWLDEHRKALESEKYWDNISVEGNHNLKQITDILDQLKEEQND